MSSRCGVENTRVDRAERRDGRNGRKTDDACGEYGRTGMAHFWSLREIERTKMEEESVVEWRTEQESVAVAGRRLVVEGRMRADELVSEGGKCGGV